MDKSNDFRFFIGFDISKKTIDYCIMNSNREVIGQGQIENNNKSVLKFFHQQFKALDVLPNQMICCLENTGHYGNLLLLAGVQVKVVLWQEDPLHLSRSLGRQRDKTDEKDAYNIALYCVANHYRSIPYELPDKCIVQLRRLLSDRLRLVRQRQALQTSKSESKAYELYPSDPQGNKIIDKVIQQIGEAIDALDQRIHEIIAQSEALNKAYQIVRSVPGFGPKNTPIIMVLTEGFSKLKTAKACACYAGVSPHQRQSRSSLNRRARVNKSSSRVLKAALHQGAKFLIMPQCKESLFKQLYDRLVAKGRTYRQAINAVRNKMLTVLYACLKNEKLYDKKYHQSLA